MYSYTRRQTKTPGGVVVTWGTSDLLKCNKNNRARHVSAKQGQGQIVDMSCFWNPWHGLEGVSALFALFQTSCIPSSTASRECSQLCTTQLSPFATEVALSWTRHAVRGAETELIVMLTCVCLEMWYKCRCGWLLYSLVGQKQWISTLWSFRARGKRLSARLGLINEKLLLSQTGIKPTGQRPSNPPTFQSKGAPVIPPLQCSLLCLNSLIQIYVWACWGWGLIRIVALDNDQFNSSGVRWHL